MGHKGIELIMKVRLRGFETEADYLHKNTVGTRNDRNQIVYGEEKENVE